jgi:hypothetical protein
MLTLGVVMIGVIAWRAVTVHLRPEDVRVTLRPVIVGATLVAIGVQTILMSFFYSMLGVAHVGRPETPAGAPGKRA